MSTRLKIICLLIVGVMIGMPLTLGLNAALGGVALRANVAIHIAPPLEIIGVSEFQIEDFVFGQEVPVNVQILNPIGNPTLNLRIISETIAVIPTLPNTVPIAALLPSNVYDHAIQGGETISFDFSIVALGVITEGDYHMTISFYVVESEPLGG